MSAQDPERAAALIAPVLVWPVAIASWRGRVRRASHA